MSRIWIENAACGQADPGLFDTDNRMGKQQRARKEAAALAYCGSCPVRLECLRDAIEFEASSCDDPIGILGGMLPEKRIPLILQLRSKGLKVAS